MFKNPKNSSDLVAFEVKINKQSFQIKDGNLVESLEIRIDNPTHDNSNLFNVARINNFTLSIYRVFHERTPKSVKPWLSSNVKIKFPLKDTFEIETVKTIFLGKNKTKFRHALSIPDTAKGYIRYLEIPMIYWDDL